MEPPAPCRVIGTWTCDLWRVCGAKTSPRVVVVPRRRTRDLRHRRFIQARSWPLLAALYGTAGSSKVAAGRSQPDVMSITAPEYGTSSPGAYTPVRTASMESSAGAEGPTENRDRDPSCKIS